MSRLAKLRDALRDVPDDALPGLRDLQRRNATVGIVIAVVAGAPVFVLDAWVDLHFGLRSLVFVIGWCSANLGLWWLNTHALKQRPDVTLFLMGVVFALALASTPFMTAGAPILHFVDLMLIVPLVNTIIGFPRARLIPPLVALAVVAEIGSVVLATGELPARAVMHATAAVALGLLAMGSTTTMRRVWHEWEQGKSQMRASDRMAQLGRMTAGLAHELKTPIATTDNAVLLLDSLVDELRRSIGDPQITHADLREIAAELSEQATTARRANARVASFVRAMRDQTQGMLAQEAQPIDVAHRLDTVRTMLSHRLRKANLTLEFDLADDVQLSGDAGKLDQLATNLVENAINAMAESGVGTRVIVRARQRRDGLALEVIDDGPGVPASHAKKIFDYLFTTRGNDQGTGLGLAICRDIAEGSFHGSLVLADSASRGAHFVAVLRDDDTSDPEAAAVAAFTPSQALSEPTAA